MAAGDEDTDGAGIAENGLKPNNGTIKKNGGTLDADLAHPARADQPGHKVDGIRPVIESVGLALHRNSDLTHVPGETLTWIVLFSEDMEVEGAPYIEFPMGDETRTAAYIKDRASLGIFSESLNVQGFGYTFAADDFDEDGLNLEADSVRLNGGTIRDMAGNDAALDYDGIETMDWHKVAGTKVTTTVDLPAGPVHGPFDATITFSHDVTGFVQNDVTVGNGTVTVLKATNAREYVATIEPATSGDVTVSVEAGVAQYTSNSVFLNQASDTATVVAALSPITGFTLFDNETGQDVRALEDGAVVEAQTSARLNIRADTAGTVGSVRLELTGRETASRTENVAPWYLFGDKGNRGARPFPAGSYTVTATPYQETWQAGTAGATRSMSFTVKPHELSVADAQAEEGTDATLAFTVTLAPSNPGTVTVEYTTVDGTATAGADYTAASGTLTFAPGETSQTVAVTLLDDVIDEGAEIFTLKLSNASHATLTDAEATGTITNNDPLQWAWLARFGRTVSSHVVDAVGERLRFRAGRAPRLLRRPPLCVEGRRHARRGRGAPPRRRGGHHRGRRATGHRPHSPSGARHAQRADHGPSLAC